MLTQNGEFSRQVELIEKQIEFIIPDGRITELRAFGVEGKNYAGYFDSPRKLAEAAAYLSGKCPGVYFVPNKIKNIKSNGNLNKLYNPKHDECTKDEDIEVRLWVFIDVDPNRPGKTSATKIEKEAAWRANDGILQTLKDRGFSGVIAIDSGNGYHEDIPVILPNTPESKNLIDRFLNHLNRKYGNDLVKIDAVVSNASRILKIPGTMACKGESTDDRPHRMSSILMDNRFQPIPWNKENADGNVDKLNSLVQSFDWEEANRYKNSNDTVENRIQRCIKYLATLPPAIEGSNGSKPTMNAARVAVYGFDLGVEIGFQLVREHYSPRCVPPWSDSQIRHKCEDANTKPYDKPRGWLISLTLEKIKSEASSEEWKQPIPLDSIPSVKPFPMVLPSILQQFVEECAWATNTPIDFVAIPMLAIAAGAIGNSRQLAITRTHIQSTCLFTAVIGPPGSGKSNPQTALMQPMYAAQKKYYAEWNKELLIWKAKEVAERGEQPKLRRCFQDDTTTEAMMRILSENPRGILMLKDELAALVTSLNQYKSGKGSDRQIYLKIWGGSTIHVDRKSQEKNIPIIVHKPMACITGGIQPEIIECFRGDKRGESEPPNDGFLDRFLVTYPEIPLAVGETWREISQTSMENWCSVVNKLLQLEMIKEEEEYVPLTVSLTTCGKAAWVAFTNSHAEEVNNDDFPDWLKGPWAKMTGYCGRLALLLQYLRYMVGETDCENVEGESLEKAAQLVDYFKSHTQRLYSVMGMDSRIKEAVRIVGWIVRHPEKTSFTRRDLYADLRRSFKTPESLDRPLTLLEHHHYLRGQDSDNKSGPGRRPTRTYDVNPFLLERHKIHKIHEIDEW